MSRQVQYLINKKVSYGKAPKPLGLWKSVSGSDLTCPVQCLLWACSEVQWALLASHGVRTPVDLDGVLKLYPP